MRKLIGALGLAATVLLAACGGGGGSAGDTQEQYSITLRADRTSLPVNLAGERPGLNGYSGIGAYSPYTTTLYVSAREGNDAIQGSGDTEVFGCNVAGGLDVGSLYYLDGKDEHEVEVMVNGTQVKIPGSYRSISLPSNSGGASFHLHAGNQSGVVRITCSITDPRDSRVYSASVDITVGGGAGPAKAANVRAVVQAPYYLGTRGNLGDIPESVALQAEIRDDANQMIPNPPAANLQVSVLPSAASEGARLLWNGQSGSVLQVSTVGGLGTLSLRSGFDSGPIVLELVTDRFDNNVTNGIQDPITARTVVYAYDGIESTAMTVEDADLTVANGVPFATALKVSGGFPPYTWSLVGGKLPAGLSLSPSGLISGTPNGPEGNYPFTVRVTDGKARYLVVNQVIKLEGDPAVVAALNANCSGGGGGGGGGGSSVCELPEATDGQPYFYVFSAISADPDLPITWSFGGLPVQGLSGNGTTGTISGTPTNSTCATATPVTQTVMFTVTAKQGTMSATRAVSIKINCPS